MEASVIQTEQLFGLSTIEGIIEVFLTVALNTLK
jgi:hypothetical protein